METINLGRVAFVYKGDYSAVTTYNKMDVVFDGESSFVSQIDNNVGNPLVNGLNWKYLSRGNNLELQEAKQDIATLETDLNKTSILLKNKIYETLTHTRQLGYLVSSTNGELSASSGGRSVTIITESKGYSSLTFKISPFGGNYGYGFILSDNSWVGYKTTEHKEITIQVPAGAKEFRTCWMNTYFDTNYFKAIIPDSPLADVVKANTLAIESIQEDVNNHGNDINNIKFDITSSIALSYTKEVGLIDTTNGAENTTPGFSRTKIQLDTRIRKLSFGVTAFGPERGYGFILSDDTWVGYKTPLDANITVDVPAGAKEFRTCWRDSVIPVQNIYGYVTLDYVKKDLYDKLSKTSPEKKYQFGDIAKFDMTAISVPIIPSVTPTTANIYSLYDSLVTDYPGYVTRTDCSDADIPLGITRPDYLNGLPIYMYKFKPVVTRNNLSKHIKFYISTGTHAETQGMYTVYEFFKLLCSSYATNPDFMDLYSNVEFYVIPVVSPWGLDNKSRTNFNGVNINRNFPTKNWRTSDIGPDYGGPSAGSEYETKIVMYYLNQIQPQCAVDAHTGGMTIHGDFGSIGYNAQSEINGYILENAAREISNRWCADDSRFPKYPTQSLLPVGRGYGYIGDAYFGTTEIYLGESLPNAISCNIEFSVENRWYDGILTSTDTTGFTPQMRKELLQYIFHLIMKMCKGATLLPII